MFITTTRTLVATLIACVGFASTAHAAETIHPGDYENPNGNLSVSSKRHFKIDAFGANESTCSLDGKIDGDRATLEGEEGSCVVTFHQTDAGIDVSSNESCRFYCGMRARFDGMYFKPAVGCSVDERNKTRDAFKGLYAKKDFAAAQERLKPVLTNCASLIARFESLSIRNDLAVTQFHLHDKTACLKTLEPFTADADKSDDDLRDDYPPSDFDDYLPLIKAARTNLKLCRGLPAS